MKVATILPDAFLGLIAGDGYHMCLAHLLNDHNTPYDLSKEVYTKFYRSIGHDKSKYLILDNGVIEGDRRPIQEIVKKALYIGADEIILPDVLFDMDHTLDIGYGALRWVRDNFPLRIMAVPQGETIEEWLDCAYAMIDWNIDCLGIPKSLIRIGGRDARLEVLQRLGNKVRGLDIHLLGCWQSPLEIKLLAAAEHNGMIPKIRGVDSAIPYVFTKAGLRMDEDDRPDVKFEFNETEINLSLLKENIDMWRKAPYIETFGGL